MSTSRIFAYFLWLASNLRAFKTQKKNKWNTIEEEKFCGLACIPANFPNHATEDLSLAARLSNFGFFQSSK